MIQHIARMLGIESYRVSHTERLAAMGGACCGIFAVYALSASLLPAGASLLIVASMGASATLLFAVPHGTLSQPWPLLGGHLLSALIGVVCAQWFSDPFLAAPLAVGLAVGAMHYLRCIHPPGGATALTAVVGGPEVIGLGYTFILSPVLLNALIILAIAIGFNYFFPWRRYPAYLNRPQPQRDNQHRPLPASSIAHEDFVYALSEIDSLVDVSEQDLLRIYDLVMRRQTGAHLQADQLRLGHYYSNGQYGTQWSVRQIVDWDETAAPAQRQIVYKTVAGAQRRQAGLSSAEDFAHWAKHEVFRDEENWRRVTP